MRKMIFAQSVVVVAEQDGLPIITLNYDERTAKTLVFDLLPSARPEDFVLTTELTTQPGVVQLRVIGIVSSEKQLKLSTPMILARSPALRHPNPNTVEYLIAGRIVVGERLMNILYQNYRVHGWLTLRCGIHNPLGDHRTVSIENWELRLTKILNGEEFREYFLSNFAA